MLRARFALACLAIAMVFALTGCGGGSNSPQIQVRAVNALVNSSGVAPAVASTPTVDFTIDGRSAGSNVAFGNVTPSQIISPETAGATHITVSAVEHGTGRSVAAPASVSVYPGRSYSVALVGVAGSGGTTAPRLLVIEDLPVGAISPVPEGQAPVRIVDLTPDSRGVKLIKTEPGDNGTTIDIEVAGLTTGYCGNASDYVNLPTARRLVVDEKENTYYNYIFSLRSQDGSSIPSATTNIQLYTQRAYTFLVIGMRSPESGQPPLDLRVVSDNLQSDVNAGK
jgi:hypothetical protein